MGKGSFQGKLTMTGKSRLNLTLVLLGIVALLAALLVCFHYARQSARRCQYTNNMKQVALAFLNFDDAYGRLPPAVHRNKAGRACCSWRLRMIPFMEGIMREIEYDQPWDDPVNEWISTIAFSLYCWQPGIGLDTNVVTITGPGTAFEEGRAVSLKDLDNDTILAIEIANSGIRWAEPSDLNIRNIPDSITQGVDGRGVLVAFADGKVWFLRADVPLDELKKFFTIEGAKRNDREQVLGQYANDRLK
jgi:hypothetical protein